jgi:hypothetical protein
MSFDPTAFGNIASVAALELAARLDKATPD